jgi:hypothetical protein
MKYTFMLLSAIILFLASCSSGPEDLEPFMVDAGEFNIDQHALKNGEKVRILGASGNLTKEHKIDFYNLVVVQSIETGDTVNVLVTTFFDANHDNPEVVFISNTSIAGKLFENPEDLERVEGKKADEIEALKFDKVFYDSEFIQVDVRKYPAVTGLLGDFTIEGELENISY